MLSVLALFNLGFKVVDQWIVFKIFVVLPPISRFLREESLSSFLLKNGTWEEQSFPLPGLLGRAWGRLGVRVVSKMRVIDEIVHRFRNSSLILSPYENKRWELTISASVFNWLLGPKLCNEFAPTWQLRTCLFFVLSFNPLLNHSTHQSITKK